jgi:hypothetical protein
MTVECLINQRSLSIIQGLGDAVIKGKSDKNFQGRVDGKV